MLGKWNAVRKDGPKDVAHVPGDEACPVQPAPPERVRDATLLQGIREGADAVLLEPTAKGVRIFYHGARGNERWEETMFIPLSEWAAILVCFREAAGLPASAPPRFEVAVIRFEQEGVDYDAAVSFLPTTYGVRLAIRLSPHADKPPTLTVWEERHLFSGGQP